MTARSIPLNSFTQALKDPARWRKFFTYLSDFLANAVLQLRIYKKLYPGLMHALIFWGVTLQVLGTAINLMQMQLFIPFVELPFPRGGLYLAFELVMDMAGVAILLGVSLALFRRLVQRPKTLETRWDDLAALALLALIPLAGFTLESLRLVATTPPWSAWSPVGSSLAAGLQALGVTPEWATAAHDGFFWGHAALALTLVGSIPFTKLRHLVFTPLNVLLRERRKAGELQPIENIDEAELLGVGKVSEFTPRQLLSFDACVRCGRCEEACPASASGMPFTPRLLVQSLRQAMLDSLGKPNGKAEHLLDEHVPEEAIWSCTTCGACQASCPAFVNAIDEIVDMRRYRVLTTGKLPKSVADMLRNMERQGNPWGIPADERLAWIEELQLRELAPGESTDVLFFMGCAATFDERNKKSARAFVHLLRTIGADVAVLGLDEMCCGECARRLGHEALFQEFARQNIETLSKVSYKHIVTQCPHCYNTLKNEYRQFGANLAIQHYTEYLAEHAAALPVVSPNGAQPVVYHDSCYLGRYNQVYRQPRQVLENADVHLVEMQKHGEGSFCCGGGGGQMWMETNPNTRINHRRLEQALETNASTIATACPYCLLMFDDAVRSKGLGEKLEVVDIAEILEKRLN